MAKKKRNLTTIKRVTLRNIDKHSKVIVELLKNKYQVVATWPQVAAIKAHHTMGTY